MSLHIITGAAGFIGSHLTDALLARGARVVGVDDLSLGSRDNLWSAAVNERFSLHVGDLNDTAAVGEWIDVIRDGTSIDTLWHLAANSDIQAGVADADVDFRRTFLTTLSALKLCRRFSIRRVVFASTSAVYGELPGPLSEDSGPLFPISNYGAMKLASEASLSAALTDCLEWLAIVRFPNVVGSRSTHGVLHDFLAKLAATPRQLIVLGDGSQQKPYVHVSDLVGAMTYIRDHAPGRIAYYNVGDGATSTSVADIARIVVEKVSPGAEIAYTGGARGWAGDVPRFQYDTAKIRRLGWQPSMTSTQAISRAVEELAASR